MYGYRDILDYNITSKELLLSLDQREVFQHYIRDKVYLNKEKLYTAPYRNDTNPSCYFIEEDGILYFIDFAHYPVRKNCIGFIMSQKNLSYSQAILYLQIKFNSCFLSNYFSKNGVLPLKEEIILERPSPRGVIFYPRKWDIRDKLFWSKYHITKKQLLEDKVIPIQAYRYKDSSYTIITDDIAYAYLDFNQKVKIYRPYNKKYKWATTCNSNDIGSINHLNDDKSTLVITKSYKDCRVLRNMGLQSIWLQNEVALPSLTILHNITKPYHRVYIWFDSDEVGIKNAKKLYSIINSFGTCITKYIYLPQEMLLEGIKDPSDLISKKSKKELTDFINLKIN